MWASEAYKKFSGSHYLNKHQSLNEYQERNVIKNMSKKKTDELKWKLEEAEDSLNISIVSILPPPKVIEKQVKLEDLTGEGVNIVFEMTV